MRPADFTAVLFAAALLVMFLFARAPQLAHLSGSDADWLTIIAIILGFFGLGTLLHSVLQGCRTQLRAHRLKSR
jgi:hypothetical protein